MSWWNASGSRRTWCRTTCGCSATADLSGSRTRHVDDLADRRFDHVITLCDKAREVCPEFGARRVHWSMADPGTPDGTGQVGYAAFEYAAADIDTRIRYLMPVLNIPETVTRSEP